MNGHNPGTKNPYRNVGVFLCSFIFFKFAIWQQKPTY